ncbi:putative metal-binding motif-containing protein [Desulfosarcina sp.]|nr:putative metal-binding motif-containing protein [Desulfosarcina sp.]
MFDHRTWLAVTVFILVVCASVLIISPTASESVAIEPQTIKQADPDLRIRIETTADWTSVRLVSGAILNDAEILSSSSEASNASFDDDYGFWLNQPLIQAEEGNLVEMVADLFFTKEAMSESLEFEIERGHIGATTLGIYRYVCGQPDLIETFIWDEIQPSGENVQSFTMPTAQISMPPSDDIDNDCDGFTENQGDCDDSDDSINPNASEICGDGIDQDCDGSDAVCAYTLAFSRVEYRRYDDSSEDHTRIGVMFTDEDGNYVDPHASSWTITYMGEEIELPNNWESYYFALNASYDQASEQWQYPDTLSREHYIRFYIAPTNTFGSALAPAGSYHLTIETDDGIYQKELVFGGKQDLPPLDASTFQFSYNQNGDLTISWALPDSDQFPEGADLKLVLEDAKDWTMAGYFAMPPTVERITIPQEKLALIGAPDAYRVYMRTHSQDRTNRVYSEMITIQSADIPIKSTLDNGYLIGSDLWLKAVLQVPDSPVTLVWKMVGADITPSGDQVISGYLYADPKDFAYGSQFNPEVFVKAYIAANGWANIAFNHVTVDTVAVFSSHLPDEGSGQSGTISLLDRLALHQYNGVSIDTDLQTTNPDSTATPYVKWVDGGYVVNSGLWSKALLHVPGNPVTLIWKEVGSDTTPTGDRVISGYFYADPTVFEYGSMYNPEVFVKIYIAANGWANMAYNHVTVDDVSVYSAYPYLNLPDHTNLATLNSRLQEHTFNGVQIVGDTDANKDNDGDGFTENQNDCNDANSFIHPAALEICGDGVDQNCDGIDPVCTVDNADIDDDGDGFTENQNDCNDTNANIYPGARETCGDGIDQDCNGSDKPCQSDNSVAGP